MSSDQNVGKENDSANDSRQEKTDTDSLFGSGRSCYGMANKMNQYSAECKEFLRYLKFCTLVANFESVSSLPEKLVNSGRTLIAAGEVLFLLYRNKSSSDRDIIWITDRAIYSVASDGAVMRVAYEDIDSVKLPFDDPETAIKDEDLRKLRLYLKNGKVLELPVNGITNGDLDLFKLSFIVAKAQLALGNNSDKS